MHKVDPDQMTFAQFQASGRDVDAAGLARVTGLDEAETVYGGRVYAGDTYIDYDKDRNYCLTIFNEGWGPTRDLASLERRLYDFAVGERVLTHETGSIEQLLCDLLRRWTEKENLEFISADDLERELWHQQQKGERDHEDVTRLVDQRRWLEAYGALWDLSV